MKTILVDIDNTIVDQVPRKIKALESIGITSVGEDVVKQDFTLSSVLHGTNRGAFYRIILGTSLQEHLVAFPGASQHLNELRKDYRIIYISARPDSQRDITINLLERLGFPKPDGDGVELSLWPLQGNIADFTDDEVDAASLKWKRTYVSEIAASQHLFAAISDTASDVATFASLGIPSILFHSHSKAEDLRSEIEKKISNRFISQSINFTSDWHQVASFVKALDKSEEELATLVKTHSSEYAVFLGQLDIKAQLLLIVATFLGTSFFAILWYTVSQFNPQLDRTSITLLQVLSVVAGIGLIASFLAMTFSIRAFGSRHTRGHISGRFITLGAFPYFFGNFIPTLIGKEPCPPESPIEEARLANKQQGQLLRRLTHLAFFQHHYGTYDPTLIENQRMLDLRAMNYAKIYPEIYARNMVLTAITMMFICSIIIIASMLLK